MFKKSIFTALTLITFSASAFADLVPWKDYQESDGVWLVSAIRVDANMDDAYLEGIKKTWVTSDEAQKKLGHIESYSMFRSVLLQSGDCNLVLIVKFSNTEVMAPNRARYDAFMKAWAMRTLKRQTNICRRTIRRCARSPAIT